MVSFEVQKVFILMMSLFFVVACTFDVIAKPLSLRSQDLCLFFPKSFIILALMFRSLIPFELMFLYRVRYRGPTSFFCMWLSSVPGAFIEYSKCKVKDWNGYC